jgi:hypothetical protein
MQIGVNDDVTKKGMMLLRDFIRDVTVVRRSKASARQFIDLAENDFLIYAGINTIGSTNILDVWVKYRNLLIAWLDMFTREYEIRAPLGVLPIDYQARVSLLTLLLLARDLIETHDYVFDGGENREIVNTPIVSGTTLYDMVRFIYPIALWGGEPSGVLSIASILSSNIKGLLNRGGKWNVILYAPLLASGIMTEDFIHKLAKYLNPEYAGKLGFTTTGLGQAFMKYAMLIPRYSLDTRYYYTAIITFIAISHVHYSVLETMINKVLDTDPNGSVHYMQFEYSNYANYIRALDAFPDLFMQAYTRGDALRDLAAMTFTLINARLELLNKDQDLHDRLVSKYSFLIKPPSELVRDAVRAVLLVSGRVV